MNRLVRPNVVLPAARVLLLGLVVLVAAWGTGQVRAEPAAQARATPTPTITPTRTPSPPDVALAAKLAGQGKYDAAIGAYLAVIEQGSAEERLAARVALARLYLDDGQLASTVRQLDAYLLEAPEGVDVRAGQYLLAETLALQGEWQGALPLYDVYIRAGGGASTYARLGRAEALARLGRGPEAAQEAARALRAELPRSVRLAFVLTMAQALEVSHPGEALVWYLRLQRESEAPVDQALALWRSALIRRDLGDDDPLIEAWTTVIQRFPETPTAQAIVEVLPSTQITIDSYYVGLVYYRGGRDEEAREAFQASLEVNQGGRDRSLAARASYYLAVLDEGAGALEKAVDAYGRVVELDPRVELADDALWWRGRLLEQAGRDEEAALSYRRILSGFEGSDWALEARFRLALLAYDGGRPDKAAKAFADIADGAEDEERQRALLWQGKALAAAEDEDAAEAAWRELREEAPSDYYGLRAAVLLGDAGGKLKDTGLAEAQDPNWASIEAWLLEASSRDPSSALEALLYDRHWGLGQELLAHGMRRRAGAEFVLLLEDAGEEVASLYQLARFFRSVGMSHLSSRAATRLLRAVPAEAVEDAPGDLWRLAYPAPFGEVLREAADDAKAPDLLLLALVRQESFFDPLAGSPAGALGLTQVMPATGEAIAKDLAVAEFESDDLYRPALSLLFGAQYLHEQLEAFDGDIYQALAAYNGGPGNARRWRSVAGADVDRFVEEIEFAQTKAYVQLVSENLARYRHLYQGLDEPSLPED